MRVSIKVDSASTAEIRALMVALNHVGMTGELRTGVNGPEAWSGETPKMTVEQFADVSEEMWLNNLKNEGKVS